MKRIEQLQKRAEAQGFIAASSIEKESFVRKIGDEYCVISHKTGKKLGCYPTEAQAEKRLEQIQYFKHKKGARERPLVGEDWETGKRFSDVTGLTSGGEKLLSMWLAGHGKNAYGLIRALGYAGFSDFVDEYPAAIDEVNIIPLVRRHIRVNKVWTENLRDSLRDLLEAQWEEEEEEGPWAALGNHFEEEDKWDPELQGEYKPTYTQPYTGRSDRYIPLPEKYSASDNPTSPKPTVQPGPGYIWVWSPNDAIWVAIPENLKQVPQAVPPMAPQAPQVPMPAGTQMGVATTQTGTQLNLANL